MASTASPSRADGGSDERFYIIVTNSAYKIKRVYDTDRGTTDERAPIWPPVDENNLINELEDVNQAPVAGTPPDSSTGTPLAQSTGTPLAQSTGTPLAQSTGDPVPANRFQTPQRPQQSQASPLMQNTPDQGVGADATSQPMVPISGQTPPNQTPPNQTPPNQMNPPTANSSGDSSGESIASTESEETLAESKDEDSAADNEHKSEVPRDGTGGGRRHHRTHPTMRRKGTAHRYTWERLNRDLATRSRRAIL